MTSELSFDVGVCEILPSRCELAFSGVFFRAPTVSVQNAIVVQNNIAIAPVWQHNFAVIPQFSW